MGARFASFLPFVIYALSCLPLFVARGFLCEMGLLFPQALRRVRVQCGGEEPSALLTNPFSLLATL